MIRTIALLAFALPPLTGCITETEGSQRVATGMRTQGVVVSTTPDVLWERARSVLASMTSEPLESRGVDRSAVTTVRGAEVRILVEPHARGAALHVTSTDQSIADEVRLRSMR